MVRVYGTCVETTQYAHFVPCVFVVRPGLYYHETRGTVAAKAAIFCHRQATHDWLEDDIAEVMP